MLIAARHLAYHTSSDLTPPEARDLQWSFQDCTRFIHLTDRTLFYPDTWDHLVRWCRCRDICGPAKYGVKS